MARLDSKPTMALNFLLLLSFLLILTMAESKLLNIGIGRVKIQEVEQRRIACSGLWCPGKKH
ncbi:hypothetical protein QQP08_014404 [Theobroma cacao]|nr:hypothetical protein QQP08_014404 [Theobroma cacao]